jgi:hypothetical protein
MFWQLQRTFRLVTFLSLLLLAGLLVVVAGCGGSTSEPSRVYGEPNDWNGRNSVAGSSVFKNLLTEQGFRVYKFGGLSERSKKLDAIVWFPTDIRTPSTEAIQWFDAWLGASSNRVLIYMGRDCNPVEDYWKLAAAGASPTNATDFLREAALASAENDLMRSRLGDLEFSRWFIVDNRDPRSVVSSWKGPWADEFKLTASPITVRGRLVPVSDFSKGELESYYAAKKAKAARKTSALTNPAGTTKQKANPANSSSPTSNPKSSPISDSPITESSEPSDSDQDNSDNDDAETKDSTDSTKDSATAKDSSQTSSPPANSPTSPPVTPSPFGWMDEQYEVVDWESEKTHYLDYESQTLLADEDNFPFIFEVTKPEWQNGRILVVSNATPFLNLGMTDPNNRRLASVLTQQLSGVSRVGIVVSPNLIPVDDGIQDDRERPFGLLTTWPLNLITLHAAFFGLLILIALFPVFGRPRALSTPSTQDFGDHIQALGELMYSTGDRSYALHAIANYFRTVRGEASNPWAQVDTLAEPTPPTTPMPSPLLTQTAQTNTNTVIPQSGDKS